MRVALHACCGPCLLEPFEDLVVSHEVVVVFANPNIQPAAEYELRRDTLREWVERRGIPYVEVEYDPTRWERAVSGVRDDPNMRCPHCYELRLSMVAAEAPRLGCDALATTLSVSPYQDAAAIDRVGREIAEANGLRWLFEDYRPRYAEATRRSRAEAMYRQNYCGCLPSRAEAEQERARRRAERRQG